MIKRDFRWLEGQEDYNALKWTFLDLHGISVKWPMGSNFPGVQLHLLYGHISSICSSCSSREPTHVFRMHQAHRSETFPLTICTSRKQLLLWMFSGSLPSFFCPPLEQPFCKVASVSLLAWFLRCYNRTHESWHFAKNKSMYLISMEVQEPGWNLGTFW